MKPDTRTAVQDLVREARQKLPFHLNFDGHCEGRCEECAFKLLEFLEMDLSYWEYRLKRGDIPNLGEVHALARDCSRVYALLQDQGLAD